MRGTTHLTAGLWTGLVVAQTHSLDGVSTWWVLQLSMVGSLLPDIDHPQSIIGRRLPVSWAFGKHRTFTHSIVFVFMLLFGLQKIAPIYHLSDVHIYALMAGYISHIVLDMMTPHGVALLYPSLRRWRLLPRTASELPVEDMTLAVNLLACTWLMVGMWVNAT